MKKNEFPARFTWATGGSFDARVKIGSDGWGAVYDKASGLNKPLPGGDVL